MRDIGIEIYGIIIAIIFAALGIWVERQRGPAILVERGQLNENAVRALGLTQRELDMLGRLYTGKSNKEIARDLNISPNTVKTHLTNLYGKLGVRNRTQAVSKATELSLLHS